MDVVSVLKETRTRFKTFNIQVTGELSREKPQTYIKVHIIYQFTGEELDADKINRAVVLSVEEQCGVLMMFKKFAEVSYEVQLS
jgi:putative redox protein